MANGGKSAGGEQLSFYCSTSADFLPTLTLSILSRATTCALGLQFSLRRCFSIRAPLPSDLQGLGGATEWENFFKSFFLPSQLGAVQVLFFAPTPNFSALILQKLSVAISTVLAARGIVKQQKLFSPGGFLKVLELKVVLGNLAGYHAIICNSF